MKYYMNLTFKIISQKFTSELVKATKIENKILKYEVDFEELEDVKMPFKTVRGRNEEHSVAGFQFRLKRRLTPIFVSTYLPCMLLLIISFIGFLIPVHMIPGRMALLVTIFLMLVNISTSEKTQGPNVNILMLQQRKGKFSLKKFQTQTMTALDIWLILAKITLFLELLEYAIVLHLRFSNARLPKLAFKRKRCKCTMPYAATARVESNEEMDNFIVAKCKIIDTQAFFSFLFGTIFINFVYFMYYLKTWGTHG